MSTHLALNQQLLKQLLIDNNLPFALVFEDKYTLLLQQEGEKWKIMQLAINYAYNLI